MAKQTIKVLLVEDNPGDIRLIQEFLREVTTTAFKLTQVERLDEALKYSDEESFDIVLLDLSLPDSQGLETFVKIHRQIPAIPIIVLTDLDDETLATKAVQAGAQDYLVKGQVSSNLLLRSMRYAIERQRAEETVRQSNERLMLALDAAKTGTWDWNMLTNEILWTPYHEIIFGYESGTLRHTYTDWSNRVHPEDLPQVEACIQAAVTLRQDFQCDYRVVWQDGSIRWVNSFGRFYYNSSGQAYRMVGVVNDITQRKQAEEGLRQSEERWQLALKGNNDGIWDHDLRTNKHFLSTKCLEILGYSEPEFDDFHQYFHKWVELIHSDDQKKMMSAFQAHLQHQTPYYVAEYRMLASDGTYKWILSRGQALWDEAGNPVRAVGSITDITERKLSEQKIGEQAALLDVANDAIFVRNWSNQQIVFWNQGAECLYGWTKEEALEKNANKLLYNEPSPQLEAAISTVAECGSWQGELHQVTRTDKKIIVQSRWTLMRDEQRKPKSILVVNTDITQKKQLEAQFLRAQRLESIGTLASGIAHDINNLLAPMLMSAQLLQMKISDERSQHLLQTIESNAKRGAALVKQVLSFTRGIEGKRTNLQIRHLILEIEQIVKATFPKSIELYVDIASDLWTVFADATQLHQVLMNLVVNARDAMPDAGTLSISAENMMIDEHYAGMNINAKTGFYMTIAVTDTGMGMPPEILERIFEPFFTTKEVGKGTGLGLSTVIGIIKSHGGFVNVYSEVGRGTTFKVYLPAMEGVETQQLSPLEILRGNGELVLLVDDEAAIREITRASLETHNYRVLTASDGVEALAAYAQHQQEINVVLMDIMMPSMDGAIASCTLQKINPSVKIIATSGIAPNEKIAKATGIGIRAFLPKPYTIQELLQTINQVKKVD